MYGVKFNVRAPHRFLRMGALCWLRNTNNGSGNARFQIVGMSRRGRQVEAWVDARDLTNYRAGWFPDSDDVTQGGQRFPFATREEAEAWAAAISAAYAAGPVRPHAIARGNGCAEPPCGGGASEGGLGG
jgi:hypothetical protein